MRKKTFPQVGHYNMISHPITANKDGGRAHTVFIQNIYSCVSYNFSLRLHTDKNREFGGVIQYEHGHHPFGQRLDLVSYYMVYYIMYFALSYGRNNTLGLYSLSRGGKRIVFMLEYTPFMNLRLSEYTSTVSHLSTTSKS